MKRKVLFVDDEPNVLGGLKRMLRPHQQEWTIEFADSGPAALAVLEQAPFDMIVSDMRMPGMSGAQLLEEVGQRYPCMVRIILTGQCDVDSGLRALRVAHQMLYKPCDAESLKATIVRTCDLSDLLPKNTLRTLVMRQASLPALPTLHSKILSEVNSATPSLDQIAAIISRDLAMSAKILHVVNSSFFGIRREITDPRRAVGLLGLQTLRMLIQAGGIFPSASPDVSSSLAAKSIHRHCHSTSDLARNIAAHEGASPQDVEYAATAGLFHDVGKLVLLDCLPEAYLDVPAQAEAADRPCWEVEREVFGASHAEIGACLLGLWGLPMKIVEAIAWHHRPDECPSPSIVLTAVHVANALCLSELSPRQADADHAYLARRGLLGRLTSWQALANNSGQKTPSSDHGIPSGEEISNAAVRAVCR